MKISSVKGISIVEIVVAAAIIGTSVVGIAGAIQIYLKIVYQNARETQAVLLLDETAEALQYLRDDSFSANIDTAVSGTTYTVFWNGIGYELGTSTITLPYDMTRTVVFSDVERDGNDQIASSGTADDATRKATITIAWPYKGVTETIASEMLIHDMYAN
jgi:Tfp pilus assembly protein PilV